MERFGEKCGVFGAYGKDFDAARLTYPGLFTLQHRGQESSGIVSSDGDRLYSYNAMGLVAHVYSEEILHSLPGFMAIGHDRYSTSGGSKSEHNQPIMVAIDDRNWLSLAHNGNFPSTVILAEYLKENNINPDNLTDSGMMGHAIALGVRRGAPLEESIADLYPKFTGSFSALAMTKDKVVAFRDPCGIKPFSYASLNGGYIFSSETCAIDTVGGQVIDDVKPGEMIVVSEKGLEFIQVEPANQKLDLFEFVYFARPDSTILGQLVYRARRNYGKELALEGNDDADFVIPVLDTALAMLPGYIEVTNLPFEFGLTKNRYIHKTFIMPEQHMREEANDLKHNPLNEIIIGKDVILLDDSIVRGTTQKNLVRRVRDAGARRVHVRITSAPVRYPDYYGIDTPVQSELIAFSKTQDEIRDYIGADSLRYLSYEGMIRATGLPEDMLCTSCFTGRYPSDIRERANEVVMMAGVR